MASVHDADHDAIFGKDLRVYSPRTTMTTPTEYRAALAGLIAIVDAHCNPTEYELPDVVDALTRARALLAAPEAVDGICTGCDTPRHKAIAAVAKGGVACCPDCSTLTVADRNAIREAVAQRAALEAVGPTRDEEALIALERIERGELSGGADDYELVRHALLARPVAPEAVGVADEPDVDDILRLAAIIRRVDGNNSKGAAALAEAILSHRGWHG